MGLGCGPTGIPGTSVPQAARPSGKTGTISRSATASLDQGTVLLSPPRTLGSVLGCTWQPSGWHPRPVAESLLGCPSLDHRRLFLQGPRQTGTEAPGLLWESRARLWAEGGAPPSSHLSQQHLCLALAREGVALSPGKGDRKWEWGCWPGKRLHVLIPGSLGFWAYRPRLWPGKRPVC